MRPIEITGFGHFANLSDPIITSIADNIAVFSAASLIVLALVIFLYALQWRRAMAHARRTGTAPGRVLRRLFMPVFFMWFPAIAAGSALAWFLAIYEGVLTMPNAIWLPITASVIAVVVFAGILIFGVSLGRQSVPEQPQDEAQEEAEAKQGATPPKVLKEFEPDDVSFGAIAYINHMQKSKSAAKRASLAHNLRHVTRAPVKSLSGLVLGLFFVLALGWLYNNINFMEQETERLRDETIVTAQIARSAEDNRHFGGWQAYFAGAPISRDALALVLAAGFGDYIYTEALWQFGFVRSLSGGFVMEPEQSVAGNSHIITGVSCLEGFIEENTKGPAEEHPGLWGNDIEIEFAPGFGPEDFAFNNPNLPISVILRREMLASEGLALGEEALLVESFGIVEITGHVRIIGVFDGGLSRAVNRFGSERGAVIMPLEALRHKTYGHWLFEEWGTGGLTYITARMMLEPAYNHKLDELRAATETALAQNTLGDWVGPMPLVLLMDDYVLTAVIPKMEEDLALFRTLFPIAIGVSITFAIGTSILLMLLDTKNIAIMRVLGKANRRVCFSFCVIQILLCFTGVALGLGVLFVISLSTSEAAFTIALPVLAGFYFVGTVLGSVIGAIIISAKTPLEVLEVRG